MKSPTTSHESHRERKRRDTVARISDAALRLFYRDGYEQTTIDAIAAEAEISRRNFFNYFESKDEIILAWQSRQCESFFTDLLAQSSAQRPIDAVTSALPHLVARFETPDFVAINGLIHSTQSLLALKNAMFERQEELLFEVLCRLWPAPERRAGLRLVAMMSSGALRLAFEQWREDDAPAPFGTYLSKSFATLKAEI